VERNAVARVRSPPPVSPLAPAIHLAALEYGASYTVFGKLPDVLPWTLDATWGRPALVESRHADVVSTFVWKSSRFGISTVLRPRLVPSAGLDDLVVRIPRATVVYTVISYKMYMQMYRNKHLAREPYEALSLVLALDPSVASDAATVDLLRRIAARYAAHVEDVFACGRACRAHFSTGLLGPPVRVATSPWADDYDDDGGKPYVDLPVVLLKCKAIPENVTAVEAGTGRRIDLLEEGSTMACATATDVLVRLTHAWGFGCFGFSWSVLSGTFEKHANPRARFGIEFAPAVAN